MKAVTFSQEANSSSRFWNGTLGSSSTLPDGICASLQTQISMQKSCPMSCDCFCGFLIRRISWANPAVKPPRILFSDFCVWN